MPDHPPFPHENYYRVSLKALIFDDQNRLLVSQDSKGEWEIPGGGWDHAEEYQACLVRELNEEIGANIKDIGPLLFFYRSETKHGHPKLSLAFRVWLDATPLNPQGDDLVATKFVTKQEFIKLKFQKGEAAAQKYIEDIWK